MIVRLIEAGATVVAIAGVLVFLSAILWRRRWHFDVLLTLDLWTAASLLSLFGEVTWLRLATTAAIVGAQNLALVGSGTGPKTG